MKVFLDTNVLLDVIMKRADFVGASTDFLKHCVVKRYDCGFSSLTACNLMYVLRKYLSQIAARDILYRLTNVFSMLDTTAENVAAALIGNNIDFEDEVQLQCAESWGADVIVTRDKDGFRNSSIKVMTPAEFLKDLS